jgi:hypothetical protein
VLLLSAFLFPQTLQVQNPASIEGVVVRYGTSTPVTGARVIIGTTQVLTGENGRFEFRQLQPGRYRPSAIHLDYVPAPFSDGGRDGQNVDVTLSPGQAVKDFVIALVPMGAVSGRVRDNNGNPVANLSVQALKYSYQDGRRILVPVSSGASSNLGEYRLSRLAPGPYIIRAAGSLSTTPESVTFLPVYYPGTTDAGAASPIELPSGIEFNGVDLTIRESPALHVRGRIVSGLTGEPPTGASVTLLPRRGTVATGSLQRAPVSPTGSFEFRNMAPGSYEIVASAPDPMGGRIAASASVEIGANDIDSVTLILQPQLSITGRISVENLQTGLPQPGLNGVRIELRREPFVPELLILIPSIAPDGTFTFGGVTPGEYRLNVNPRGVKGYVKSARFGALDALNPPFHINGPGQFEIVLSPNTGAVNALVAGSTQKPVFDATVVLIPDPPRRQRFDLYHVAGSDASGHVGFQDVAPGDYKVFAWGDVVADAWQDPDFVRSYEGRGKPVRIFEGGRENVELSVIPPK